MIPTIICPDKISLCSKRTYNVGPPIGIVCLLECLLVYKPNEYYSTINHCEIGVMFANLAIDRGPHIVVCDNLQGFATLLQPKMFSSRAGPAALTTQPRNHAANIDLCNRIMWGVPSMGVPKNGLFIEKIPLNWMKTRGTPSMEPPMWQCFKSSIKY